MNIRFLSFLFLTIFAVQILEIPPAQFYRNPKTCCGRSVCLCTHPHGALCPFKHGIKNDHENHTKGLAEKPIAAKSLLSEAPCATHSPKVITPGYFPDFDLVAKEIHFHSFEPEIFFPFSKVSTIFGTS